MKRPNRSSIIWPAGLILLMILFGTALGYARDYRNDFNIPRGVYIDLDKDFYEALKEDGADNTRHYTNDPSMVYLRQILENQKKIMYMLHTLMENKKK